MSETTPRIYGFFDEYRWLSNFWVEEDGLSGEHRFQAAKAASSEDYWYVMRAATPRMAKHRGRRVELRADWEETKLAVMLSVLRWKFRGVDLREKLLATGDAVLIEANGWGDTFWGVDQETGEGQNHLGDLLMLVREELGGAKHDRYPWVDEEGLRWSYPEEGVVWQEGVEGTAEWSASHKVRYEPRTGL